VRRCRGADVKLFAADTAGLYPVTVRDRTERTSDFQRFVKPLHIGCCGNTGTTACDGFAGTVAQKSRPCWPLDRMGRHGVENEPPGSLRALPGANVRDVCGGSDIEGHRYTIGASLRQLPPRWGSHESRKTIPGSWHPQPSHTRPEAWEREVPAPLTSLNQSENVTSFVEGKKAEELR
jgi:hypothetical protein